MAEFLLIHGSCHGAWSWRYLTRELASLGHTARALDLPGHGQDRTPISEISLDCYAEAILDAMHGPTIVVGHSMAGYPISRAADLAPLHFRRLVYLCAYVPWTDHSLVEMRLRAPRQPIMKAIRKSGDGKSFSILPEHAREIFYHDCDDRDVAYALQHLCPEPTLPQATRVTLGPAYATVARSYILCEQDSAIPTEFQHTMSQDFAPQDVIRLATSHSPFFSAPAELAHHLHRIAQSPGTPSSR
ncbi:alpha/beta fold hydrolase [Puniceibacterium confluentis]|uniref:alpha/beta fold hydrolase n=1 Tax=Puniceibacterium confluentis TaxID=1958944 RepID=UPI003568D4E8